MRRAAISIVFTIVLIGGAATHARADAVSDLLSALGYAHESVASTTPATAAPPQVASGAGASVQAPTTTQASPCMLGYHLAGNQCVSAAFPVTANSASAVSPATPSSSSALVSALLAEIQNLQHELATLVSEHQAAASNVNTSQTAPSETLTLSRDLSIGDSGADVSTLQTALKSLGYFTYPSITTYFGPATEAAVKAFQRAHGIAVVGRVGPQTRAALTLASTNGASGEVTSTTGTNGEVAVGIITPPSSTGSGNVSNSNTGGPSTDSTGASSGSGSGDSGAGSTSASSDSAGGASTSSSGSTSSGSGAGDNSGGADNTQTNPTQPPSSPDTSAPSVPSNLAGFSLGNGIQISWNPSTDNVGVAHYTVYRNGSVIATVNLPTFDDTSVAANTSYTYSVSATDAAGNTSAKSAAATVKAGSTMLDYTWKPLRIGAGGWVVGIDIAPDGTTVVRTDTSAGGFVWDGSEWKPLVTASSMPASMVAPDGANCAPYALRIAPTDSSRFYMACRGYVLRSDNKGTTWTLTSYPFSPMPNADFRMMGPKMAVDPHNENVVYLETPAAGAWRTTDGGLTWSQVPTAGIPLSTASDGNTAVAFDPSSGTTGGKTNTIYVASVGNGIYRSTDAGSTWSLIPGSATSTDHMVVASNGAMYYVNHNQSTNNVWKYDNGTLTNLSISGFFHSIAIDPKNPNHLVIGSSGGGVAQSFDGGATWTTGYTPSRVATDIPWLAWTAEGYMSNGDMEFNPVSGQLYFAEGIGVWKTTVPPSPGPLVWTSQSYGIEQLVANEVIAPPGGEPLVASWDRAVFYSSNPDVFPQTHGPARDTSIRHGWSLDWASSDPSVIVGVFNLGVSGGRSGYSTDGGITWNKFASYPNNSDCCGGSIAASTPTNFVWAFSNNGNVYYTKDQGATWSLVSLPGIPTSGGVETGWGWAYYFRRYVVTADRVLPNTFYLYNYGPSSDPAAGGFYKSTDGGSTWTHVYTASVNTAGATPIGLLTSYHTKFKSVPGEAGNLFFSAGLQGNGGTLTPAAAVGFWRSTDGGSTWSEVPGMEEVVDFGFGKSATDGGYPAIYAAGWFNKEWGIWRSDDDAQTWQKIGDYPLGSMDGVVTITGDPNIYGRVYIGFGGMGYAYADPASAADTGTSGSTYTIQVYQSSHGTISPDTSTVSAGASKTFTITPDPAWNISNVYVDGVDKGAISSYTFTDVTSNDTISVVYTPVPTPSVPADFTTASASTSVTEQWDPVSGVDNYVIERSANPTSGFAAIATTTGTTYTDWGLAAGVYYYRMKATNIAGSSAYTAAIPGVACGNCEAPSNGLLGYWPLDGNANDASGNNNDGTLVGSTTTFVSGKIGEAASFTGTPGNYIKMGSIMSSLDQAITVSAWVKNTGQASAGAPSGVIAGRDSSYRPTRFTLDVEKDSYGNHVFWQSQVKPASSFISSGSVPDNQWTFVTYTWDGATEDIYLNGILNSTKSATGTLQDPYNLAFYIGYAHGFGNANSYFDGLIDDVRVYDRALSASEVAELYGFDGAGSGTVASNLSGKNALAAAGVAHPDPALLDALEKQLRAIEAQLTAMLGNALSK